MRAALSIGKLALEAGVSVETIRYYQRRGLIEVPPRPPGGQRRYPESFRRTLRFIRRAQGLGFNLEEIGALLTLERAHACSETHERALLKLHLIDEKLRDLNAMRVALGQLVKQCEAGAAEGECPIIRTLAGD